MSAEGTKCADRTIVDTLFVFADVVCNFLLMVWVWTAKGGAWIHIDIILYII